MVLDTNRTQGAGAGSAGAPAPTADELAARLARALASGGLAEWAIDPSSGRWSVVSGFETIFGTAPRLGTRGTAGIGSPEDAAETVPFLRAPLGERFHAEDVPRLVAAWHALVDAGEPMAVRVRITRTDGQPRWIRIDGEPGAGVDGRPGPPTGHVRDVSELDALRAANGFLATLAGPLARIADYDDVLQRVASDVVPHLADRCTIEFVLADGSLQRVADSLHPRLATPRLPPERSGGRVPAAPLIDRIVQERTSLVLPDIGEPEVRGLSATDDFRHDLQAFKPCDYIGTPLVIDGRCFGVLGILTRRDGRRFASQELALVERVAERIASALDNARLYATVKRADERKSVFLATLSHELRNPLAAMTAGLDAIRDSVVAADERAMLAMIDRQAAGMTRMMDDLLDISRLDADKLELEPEWLSVGRAVDDALVGILPVMRDKHQRLHRRLPSPDITVRADRVRLEQMLVNLLVNASRYTPAGGSITIEARRADGDGARLVIDVSDTGVGLEEDERERIFGRFEQVGKARPAGGEGLGLGLALVRSLAALHGGDVAVHSAGKGQGSRFRITLPLARPDSPDSPDTSPGGEGAQRPAMTSGERPAEPAGEPVRVLVIDDNRDASHAIGHALARLGHEIEQAASGEAGLSACRSRAAVLVLLDIGLPDLDGYEVARRIRLFEHDRGRAPCYLVALTGHAQASDRRRALEAGFDEHVPKPVRLAGLRALIDTARHPRRAGRGPTTSR